MRNLACGLLLLAAWAAPMAAQAPDKAPAFPKVSSQWPTLEEARTASQCEGEWVHVIAAVKAADPEQDAEKQIAAGDFTLKSGMRRIYIAAPGTQSGPLVIETHIEHPDLGIARSRTIVTSGPAGVQCQLPVPHVEAFSRVETTAPGSVIELRIVPSMAHTRCGRALLVLKEDYSARFNKHVVGHRSYPHKDVCQPPPAGTVSSVSPRGVSDRPTPDMIPEQIPDIATAARFGLTERVGKFIADGADLGRRDIFDFDALRWSVVRDYRDVFDLIVAVGGTSDFCGALKTAVESRRAELLKRLAQRCTIAASRLELLHAFARRDRLAVLKALVDTTPALELRDTEEAAWALASSVSLGHVEVARFLLDRISAAQWEKSRKRLLATAVGRQDLDMMRLLLDRAPDPDFEVRFSVRVAVQGRRHKALRALAERGADLNGPLLLQPIKTASGAELDPLGRRLLPSLDTDPPIFMALHPLMDFKMVDLLLELGANPNVRDGSGRTPLMIAITHSQIYGRKAGASWIERFVPQKLIKGQEDWEHRGVEPVRTLLAKGADVKLADAAGLTALHHAARSDYAVDIARILIAHGADINARDKAGKTPLDHALEAGLVRMPEMLTAAGGRRGSG